MAVLRHDWYYDGRVFRALAFMDGCGIGRHQCVEFREAVSDQPSVKGCRELTVIRLDIPDVADVTVVDLLVAVVLDVHNLIAGRESPAEPLDLALPSGVQRRLQLDVQRARTDAASVHGAENLDVPNGSAEESVADPEVVGRTGVDGQTVEAAKKSLDGDG
jgi:hypothetical protein